MLAVKNIEEVKELNNKLVERGNVEIGALNQLFYGNLPDIICSYLTLTADQRLAHLKSNKIRYFLTELVISGLEKNLGGWPVEARIIQKINTHCKYNFTCIF